MNWDIFDSLFGSAFGNVIGNPVLAGLIIVLFFVGLLINMMLGFDAVIVIMFPVVWQVAAPFELGGSGFLPSWFFYMMVVLMGVVAFMAFMRIIRR